MRCLFTAAVAVFLLLDFPALTQIGSPYPGGYPPGGRYPGGRGGGIGGGLPPMPRLPGRGKKDKKSTPEKEAQEPLIDVAGVLRRIDAGSVVVEAQDTRIFNLKRSEKTTFSKDNKPMQPSELQPGDHVLVQSKQDEQGFFYAVHVIFSKAGTAEERAAASQPVDDLTPKRDDDDERPVLRKKAPAGAETPTETAEAVEAEAPRPVAPPPIRSLPQDEEEPAPVLRRRKPGERPPARPPARTASAGPPAPAPAREPEAPPAPARETVVVVENEFARPPDPVIEKARAMAASFTAGLPNYYCRELITRFVNVSHKINWAPQDVVSAELIYENHRERYRNIAINNKLTKKSMEELPGAWSTGEFGTVLADLFSPGTAADFVFSKEDQAGGRTALVYEFTVERQNSHWHIQAASQSIVPAYGGGVWIDKKTQQVLRIEMEAKSLPREFPFDKVESTVDYQYVTLGSQAPFLLPVHAENLMCQTGTNVCSRNVIDFRNYHKYTSESSIIFTP